MKVSDLEDPVVVQPSAKKLNINDLESPVVVPAKLLNDPRPLPMSRPDRSEVDSSGPAETEVPRTPIQGAKDAAVGAAQSMYRGAKVINKELNPLGEPTEGDVPLPLIGRVPLSGAILNPHKRRELERGASDVATLGLAERIANGMEDIGGSGTDAPTLRQSAKSDAENAPGYRDAGGVVAGSLPNPIGWASELPLGYIKRAGEKVVGQFGKEFSPGSINRNATRTVRDLEDGAPQASRERVGQDREDVLDVVKNNPDIAKHRKNVQELDEIYKKNLDSRYKEMDKILEEHENSPVTVETKPVDASMSPEERAKLSDNARVALEDTLRERAGLPTKDRTPAQTPSQIAREGIPEPIDDLADKTVATKTEPMSSIVPKGSGGEDLAAGQARRQSLPDDFNSLDKTQKITVDPVETRAKGSLDPNEVRASIVSHSKDLERTSAPQSDAIKSILGDLDREIAAETKATGKPPNLRWYRQKVTDYQAIANARPVSSTALETANQAAHGETANVIRDMINAHTGNDPRILKLNAESSAFSNLKALNDAKLKKINADFGNSPSKGDKADRFLGHIMSSHTTVGTVAKGAFHARHGAAEVADSMLARLASAKLSGHPITELTQAAIKAGISQTQIDNALAKVDKIKHGKQ